MHNRLDTKCPPCLGTVNDLINECMKELAYINARSKTGWLGGRVISVLDSGAEGAGFKSLSGNSLRQTVHTHCASVHQAAKLVAALLIVAGVTAGLAESNGSLPSGL